MGPPWGVLLQRWSSEATLRWPGGVERALAAFNQALRATTGAGAAFLHRRGGMVMAWRRLLRGAGVAA